MTAQEDEWIAESLKDKNAYGFEPPSPSDGIAPRIVPDGITREYSDRELDDLKRMFIIRKTDAKTGLEIDVKFDIRLFVEWLVHSSGEQFITIRDSGDVYIYRDGVYVKNGDTHIKELMRYIMDGYMINNYHKNEVVANVREQSYKNRSIFEHDDGIINLANGLYDMDSGKFSKHTPDYISLNKSTVIYDPDAACPNTDKFLSELAEPEQLQLYYEIAGYALASVKRYKIGFILLGNNDTGKSLFTKLLVKFVGAENVSAVQPSGIASYGHASAGLYGKLMNVVDDLGTAPLNDTGNIKAMIGDGMMDCNPKGKPSFAFQPNTLNLWCCNAVPTTNDKNFGDKFIILNCLNRYGGHSNPDVNLLEKITTPEEISGFFNKAISAFDNVVKNGGFTFDKSDSERKEDWEMKSKPIAMFIRDRCSMDYPDELTPKDGFKKAYKLFVKENGLQHEKTHVVKEYLESVGVFDKKVYERNELYNIWCYRGIKVLDKNGLPPKTGVLASKNKNAKTNSGKDKNSTASKFIDVLCDSSKKTENNRVGNSIRENLEAVGGNEETDDDFAENGFGGSESVFGGSGLEQSQVDAIRKSVNDACVETGRMNATIESVIERCSLPRDVVHKAITLESEKLGILKTQDGLVRLDR